MYAGEAANWLKAWGRWFGNPRAIVERDIESFCLFSPRAASPCRGPLSSEFWLNSLLSQVFERQRQGLAVILFWGG